MRAELLVEASPGGCRPAEVPHRLVGDGLLDAGCAPLGGEQIDAGLPPAPVLAQGFEQLRRQGNIAITRALAPVDVDDHALTVDVAHLEQRRFGAAHAGGVERIRSMRCMRFGAASISRVTSSWLSTVGNVRGCLGKGRSSKAKSRRFSVFLQRNRSAEMQFSTVPRASFRS